jgi:predicted ATP-grasp superfamily ATP-dependent carboligase
MAQQVLVLDCYEHTLTVIRSLSAAGYEVILGVTRNDLDRGYVHASRFMSSTWLHPDVVEESAQFDAALKHYLEENPQVRMIFPVGENSVRKLAAIRNSFPPDTLIAMPSNSAIATCMNKPIAYELADSCGIPIPGTRTVKSAEELHIAIKELGLPAIAKPLDSTNLLLNKKCVFIRTPDDLDTLTRSWPANDDSFVIQNEISGIRHNCDIVAKNGEIKVYFEAEILRTDQLDYAGNSVFDRSIPPNAEHKEYCERFIAAINYTGLTLIQFLKDPATGQTCFLEANPRGGAGISLAVSCGIDLPAITMKVCTGQTPEFDNDYAAYRTRSSFHDDLQGIRKAHVFGELSTGQTIRWFGRACIDSLRANYYSTFVWSDPKPTVKIYWNMLLRLLFKNKRGLTENKQDHA